MEIWIELTKQEWEAYEALKAAKIASGEWQELKKGRQTAYNHF